MISLDKIKIIPHSGGVYLFKDSKRTVIYIGKSNDLQNRVKQYFIQNGDKRIQVVLIRRNTDNIDYYTTKTEQEALLLEHNLIKKHQPKYNVQLKENNKYPYIFITDEKLPRLLYTWNKSERGMYFGPFTSGFFVSNIVDILKELYSLRKCNNKSPKKACIEFQMKRCNAPCENKIRSEKYRKKIRDIKNILKGSYPSLLKTMREKMYEESNKENFEKAGKIRDTIKIISDYIRKGKKTGAKHKNRDMVYISRQGRKGVFTIVTMRDGIIIDIFSKRFLVPISIPDKMVLKDVIIDHYSLKQNSDTKYLLLPFVIDNEDITELFTDNTVIRLYNPKSIDKRMFDIAKENSERNLADYSQKEYIPARLRELKELMNIENIPQLIGGIDISHFSGKWTSGAVICFKNGKPLKSAYRYYKLDYMGNNDYGAIMHILKRYLMKYKLDMVLIDGGIGQLNAAKKVIKELGINIELFSMSKRPDTLFNASGKQIGLPLKSGAMKLIREIRDESHRFANKLRKIQMEKNTK